MNTFAPLWSGIVDSSVWEEPDDVFRVFIAMMSLKDADHVVRLDDYKLARRIHMDPERVAKALEVLKSPDERRPGQDFDGRRIQKVEDGWLVLNGEKYRAMIQAEMRKARNRRAQAAYRARQKEKTKPLPGEEAYEKAVERGDREEAERILRDQPGLPQEGGQT